MDPAEWEMHTSVEMDIEEEYMKALNASLLIQTPLQVSLEMIQKRLREQSKRIEILTQKVQSQDESLALSSQLAERLSKSENEIVSLKNAKLSPFVQAEILQRLNSLEDEIKNKTEKLKIGLESLRLDQKFEAIKNQCLPQSVIDRLLEVSQSCQSEAAPNLDEFATVEQLNSLEAKIDSWMTDRESEIGELKKLLSSLDYSTKEKLSAFNDSQLELERRLETKIDGFKRFVQGREEVSYSEFARMCSRLESLDEKFDRTTSSKTRVQELCTRIQDLENRIAAMDSKQKIQDDKIKSAINVAVTSLKTNSQESAKVEEICQLRDSIDAKPDFAEIKKFVQEELRGLQVMLERSKLDKKRSEHAARATKFICLSCDRELQIVPGRADYLSNNIACMQEFRPRSVQSAHPLGPGIKAADHRKLRCGAEREPAEDDGGERVERADCVDKHFLYDDSKSISKPTKRLVRSKTPIFL